MIHFSQIVTESGSWFENPMICDIAKDITKDCIEGYNEDLLDPLTPVSQVIMKSIVIGSIILCIACYKWRYIADYFILTLNLMVFVSVFQLNLGMYNSTPTAMSLLMCFIYILGSSGYRYEILICSINLSIVVIVGQNLAYSRPVTTSLIFMTIMRFLADLIAFTLFNMMMIKIGEVNKRHREYFAQHVKLLNGMHEGLIILSNTTKDSPSKF